MCEVQSCSWIMVLMDHTGVRDRLRHRENRVHDARLLIEVGLAADDLGGQQPSP